jgi:hypothetical protein
VMGRHDVVVVHSVTFAGRPPRRLSCDWGHSPAVLELIFWRDTPEVPQGSNFCREHIGVIPAMS